MPTLHIRITRILHMHIASGFDLAVHVVRVERVTRTTLSENGNGFLLLSENGNSIK